MNRRRVLMAGVGLLLAAGGVPARDFPPSVGTALNTVRSDGCGAHGRLPMLREDARLRQVARDLSAGRSLHAALAASGYTAEHSYELHFSGAVTDAQLRQVLAANFCRTLTDVAVREYGAERRGREVWIALAAPLALPAVRDAALIERDVLQLVNAARAAGRHCGARYFAPAPPLILHAALTRAAKAHSDDMAAHGVFEHSGTDGSNPAARVERAGFGHHRIVGENIAAGAATAEEVTQGWLTSVPHCENIMDPRFLDIGVAYSINTARDAAIYWTQDFASP